jgi:hypothetical protein
MSAAKCCGLLRGVFMQYFGFDAYEKSMQKAGMSVVFMANDGEQDVIVVAPGEGAKNAENPGF